MRRPTSPPLSPPPPRRRRSVAAATAAAGLAAGTVLLSAGPAAALTRSCTIEQVACTTGVVPAHPTSHQIVIQAVATGVDKIRCYAYDVNGDPVGNVSSSWFSGSIKVISGLSASYFLTCIGPAGSFGVIGNGS